MDGRDRGLGAQVFALPATEGRKHMLGVVEGRLYDSATTRQLLDELVRRGLDVSQGLLSITSGVAQLCPKSLRRRNCGTCEVGNVMPILPRIG